MTRLARTMTSCGTCCSGPERLRSSGVSPSPERHSHTASAVPAHVTEAAAKAAELVWLPPGAWSPAADAAARQDGDRAADMNMNRPSRVVALGIAWDDEGAIRSPVLRRRHGSRIPRPEVGPGMVDSRHRWHARAGSDLRLGSAHPRDGREGPRAGVERGDAARHPARLLRHARGALGLRVCDWRGRGVRSAGRRGRVGGWRGVRHLLWRPDVAHGAHGLHD
jgi:hypothetical protein